jgi:hypothetical protein
MPRGAWHYFDFPRNGSRCAVLAVTLLAFPAGSMAVMVDPIDGDATALYGSTSIAVIGIIGFPKTIPTFFNGSKPFNKRGVSPCPTTTECRIP